MSTAQILPRIFLSKSATVATDMSTDRSRLAANIFVEVATVTSDMSTGRSRLAANDFAEERNRRDEDNQAQNLRRVGEVVAGQGKR